MVGFDKTAKFLRVTVIKNFELLQNHVALCMKRVSLKGHYPKNG